MFCINSLKKVISSKILFEEFKCVCLHSKGQEFFSTEQKNIPFQNEFKQNMESSSRKVIAGIDTISNRNGNIKRTSKQSSINWNEVNSEKQVSNVIYKYKLPSEFNSNSKFHFYDQMQLHIKLTQFIKSAPNRNPSQEDMLLKLQISGLNNLTIIQANCLFHNDIGFSKFCLSLVEAQTIIINKFNQQLPNRIETNSLLLNTLIRDKRPKSSLQTEVVSQMNLEQLRECSKSFLAAGMDNQLIILLSMREIQQELRKLMREEYGNKINLQNVSSLFLIFNLFELQIETLEPNSQQTAATLSATFDQYLKMVVSQKLLDGKSHSLNKIIQIAKEHKVSISQKSVEEAVSKLSSREDSAQKEATLSILNVLEQLLKSNNSSVLQARNTISTKQESIGRKSISIENITKLSEQLKFVSQPQDISAKNCFKILKNMIDSCVVIEDALIILTWVGRNNQIAAKMLLSDKMKHLIEENIKFIEEKSFSQVLFLSQQQILQINKREIISRIESNSSQFNNALLVQCYHFVLNQQKFNSFNRHESSNNGTNSLNELGNKLFEIIQSRESTLSFEDLNLLFKCIQLLQSEQNINELQLFLEESLLSRVTSESRCINLYFTLIYHKIIKEGFQTRFVQEKITKLQEIITSPSFDLSKADLFNFAQVIIAITKFTHPPALISAFIKRASQVLNSKDNNQQSFKNKNTNLLRPDQLAFIYISLFKSATLPEHWNLVSTLEQILKNEIENKPRTQKSNNELHLIQIVKLTHELVQARTSLSEDRVRFLQYLIEATLKHKSIGGDLGLQIWLFWQISLLQSNKKFALVNLNKSCIEDIFQFIKPSIKTILSELQNATKENDGTNKYKLKKQRQDMKSGVTEVSVVQLFQAIQYCELNGEIDPKLSINLQQLKQEMKQTVYFKQYQPAHSTQSSYNSEEFVKTYLQQQIQILNTQTSSKVPLTFLKEHLLEDIFCVDFYIPELCLGIEYNGKQHYFNNIQMQSELTRQEYLINKGHKIEVIRSEEWISLNPQQKAELIKNILSKHIVNE